MPQRASDDDLAFLDRLTKPENQPHRVPSNNNRDLERLLADAWERARAEKYPVLPNAPSTGDNQRSSSASSFFTERQEQLEADALNDVLNEMAAEEQQLEQSNRIELPRSSSFREVARAEHIPEISYFKEPRSSIDVFEQSDWSGPAGFNGPPPPLSINQQVERADDRRRVSVGNELPDEESIVPVADGGVYTEGGVVYLPGGEGGVGAGGGGQAATAARRQAEQDEADAEDSREEARNLLANMLGFTRHERLDVKKPGPRVVAPLTLAPTLAERPSSEQLASGNKEQLPVHIVEVAKTKKLIVEHSLEDHGPHSVDTEYAHVRFTTPVDNWRDGERIVQAIAEQVSLINHLSHIRVDEHEVSFRVDANPEQKTAADVARSINDPRFKSNLSRRLGVNVIYAGVGDKTKEDPFSGVHSDRMQLARGDGLSTTRLMVYMFAGAGVAAALVAGITLFVIKRHDKVKSKLGSLQTTLLGGDSSSNDYQELCRARMAGGKNTAEAAAASGRITTLAKENERPPSSRSSTSSWSEEPMTNMDISTGHMVLSYMEDHLRNKGRLQREWEALCRYEAEPNSRDAALQDQCEKFNRDGAPLPFDHSRVVLNHLANADGLDYINASTIVSISIKWAANGSVTDV